MKNVLLVIAMIFAVVATGVTLWGAYKTNKAILAACQIVQPEIKSMKECKVLRKAQRDSAVAELKATFDSTVIQPTINIMSRVGSTAVRLENLVRDATDSTP